MAHGEATNVTFGKTSEHRARYRSGGVAYAEGLVDGNWCGRHWSAKARVPKSGSRAVPAYELRTVAHTPGAPGTPLRGGWQWVSSKELPKTDRGARHAVVELTRPEPKKQALAVRVHTLLDGTPMLTRWLEITNRAANPIGLRGLSPWAGKLWAQDAPVRVGYWTKQSWGEEGWFGWKRLKRGLDVIRNDEDAVHDDPNFLLRNESNGEYFFGQLGWAIKYEMAFAREKDGLSFRIEPLDRYPLRVLEPGETVTTPPVHLGCVKGTFDDAVQAMHAHLRKSVMPKPPADKAYRSQYLCPGDWDICPYHGEDFNEQNMMKVADVVAAAGVELFILDGPTWCSGYGRWLEPHPGRFPRGLGPLRDYLHSKGLLFGLYFETEGGRDASPGHDIIASMDYWRNSPVYREHPEWFVRINLDLTIPEAAAYFEREVERIIEQYQLDLYRHDANAEGACPPGHGGHAVRRAGEIAESCYWRHYETLYAAIRRLRAKFPNVVFQQASGGGRRLDVRTIGEFHEHSSSDHGGSIPRLAGLSVFLPPECIVNHIGMIPREPFDLDTWLRAAYAMGNTPSFFNALLPGSLAEFPAEDQVKYRHYADLYRRFIRPLLGRTVIYHHEPVNETGGVDSGDWVVMEFMAPDRSRGWATIVRMPRDTARYRLRPRGLDPRRNYEVTMDNSGSETMLRGATLKRAGLEIRTTSERHSELVLFEGKEQET